MKRFLKKVQLFVALCLFLPCLAGCAEKQTEPFKRVDTAMGTIVSQTIYVTKQGREAWSLQEETKGREENADAIMNLISDLEEDMLSWRLSTSEIYQANLRAVGGEESQEGSPVSHTLCDIISTCLSVSEASDGAFDIALGQVTRLWNIDEWSKKEDTGYQLPDKKELEEALLKSGSRFVSLQGETLYLSEQVQLDLGAVGKGIALQVILDYLQEQKNQNMLEGAIISVGGSVLTFGEKPDGSSFRVGIVNPMDTSKNLGYLSLTGQWCVSTSGDYERFVEVDGVRYHHIIDPSTGYPADSDVRSVTILTKDGLLSDALSTACFVLGVEEGSRLAEDFGAEALFVDEDGQIHMTEGMERYFHLWE